MFFTLQTKCKKLTDTLILLLLLLLLSIFVFTNHIGTTTFKTIIRFSYNDENINNSIK